MSVVDDLLKTVDPPQRQELERIRQIVKATAPGVEEVMTYGMAGFKYKGKYLIAFAAFKDHLSVFPGSHPVEVLGSKLKDYKVSKGTIQFTLEKPLPESLIKEMVTVRMADIG